MARKSSKLAAVPLLWAAVAAAAAVAAWFMWFHGTREHMTPQEKAKSREKEQRYQTAREGRESRARWKAGLSVRRSADGRVMEYPE